MRMAGRNEAAEDLSIRALTFLVSDEALLSRFLAVTGWTPETLSEPDSRQAILVATLDYLMREEDLLLTFAANSGVDPQDVSRALRNLTGGDNDGTGHFDGTRHD